MCGGAGEITRRIEAYVGAGVSKFILRPIGAGNGEMAAQTARLIDEVLPAVAALNRQASERPA